MVSGLVESAGERDVELVEGDLPAVGAAAAAVSSSVSGVGAAEVFAAEVEQFDQGVVVQSLRTRRGGSRRQPGLVVGGPDVLDPRRSSAPSCARSVRRGHPKRWIPSVRTRPPGRPTMTRLVPPNPHAAGISADQRRVTRPRSRNWHASRRRCGDLTSAWKHWARHANR